MANWHVSRISTALVAGLLPAIVIGAALLLHDSASATPTPATSTIVARVAPAATTIPATVPPPTPLPAATTPTSPAAAPAIPLTSTATATASATPTATASPTPAAPVWVTVSQWRDHDVVFTAPFTVSGPWRIRWQLSAPTELFQVMIEEGQATPLLISGATGATTGVIDVPRGGTYSLMLHNTIPYEVIVEELRLP